MSDQEMNFPDELSDLDYLLYRGESNPSTRSTVMAVMTLESSPEFSRLSRAIDRASRVFIRLRQKVVEPSSALVPARWIIDPDFDLNYHVRRVNLSKPGGQNELLTLASQLSATPFDICRPLWEITVVDGIKLADVKTALIFKMHHAVSDGVGALKLFEQLLDLDPDTPERKMPLIPVPEEMSPERATKLGRQKAIGQLIPNSKKVLGIGTKIMLSSLTKPVDTLSDVVNYGESVQKVLGNKELYCSPLLSGRSLSRDLGIIEVPLADLKRATKSVYATVNDGFLAAVSLGLGKYHRAKLVEIDELSIAMPVNTRPVNAGDGGNHFAGARVNLPLGETDAKTCLEMIGERVKHAKSEPALSLLNYLTPTISRISSRAMNTLATQVKRPDVQLSNVQGYPVPTYLAGKKANKLIPFGPVPNVAAMITMVSHSDTCFVGIHTDAAAFDDFELLKSSLQHGFDEVLKLAKKTQHKNKAAKKTTTKAPKAAKTVAKAAKKVARTTAATKTTKAGAASSLKKTRKTKKRPLKMSAKTTSKQSGETL